MKLVGLGVLTNFETLTQDTTMDSVLAAVAADLHAAFLLNVSRAGEAHDWSGHSFSKPSGDAWLGLRVWLLDAQGGICAACGDTLRLSDMEVAHLVSNAGTKRKNGGYVPGNVYAAHIACNQQVDTAVASRMGGVDVHPLTLLRWDVVPLAWPTTGDLRQIGAEHRAENDSHGALDAHIAERIAQCESILAELGF